MDGWDKENQDDNMILSKLNTHNNHLIKHVRRSSVAPKNSQATTIDANMKGRIQELSRLSLDETPKLELKVRQCYK
jgi:hypothetical protein